MGLRKCAGIDQRVCCSRVVVFQDSPEKLWFSAAPAIDGLLNVTDVKETACPGTVLQNLIDQIFNSLPLRETGVLELIDQPMVMMTVQPVIDVQPVRRCFGNLFCQGALVKHKFYVIERQIPFPAHRIAVLLFIHPEHPIQPPGFFQAHVQRFGDDILQQSVCAFTGLFRHRPFMSMQIQNGIAVGQLRQTCDQFVEDIFHAVPTSMRVEIVVQRFEKHQPFVFRLGVQACPFHQFTHPADVITDLLIRRRRQPLATVGPYSFRVPPELAVRNFQTVGMVFTGKVVQHL